MAGNALPLLLLAGAAFLLMGKRGGDSDGQPDDTDDQGGGAAAPKPQKTAVSYYSTAARSAQGTGTGTEQEPIEWTIVAPGDTFEIGGAPLTYVEGGVEKPQTFELTSDDADVGVMVEMESVTVGPSKLILRSKTGAAPGLFAIEWTKVGGQAPGPKAIWIQPIQG